jgi:hypothetical protein
MTWVRSILAAAASALCLAACGGSGHVVSERPVTVERLIHQLGNASGCPVATETRRLPVPRSERKDVFGAIARFEGKAIFAATVECEDWLSGLIAYYDFPSAQARAAAVRERGPLQRNELYCFKGEELLVNDLAGYDYTADFCRQMGFMIHRPTGT